MPRIFDNIDQSLPSRNSNKPLKPLHMQISASAISTSAAGEDSLPYVENWSGGEGECCRLLVGMQRLPEEELREAKRLAKQDSGIDNQTALRLKTEIG